MKGMGKELMMVIIIMVGVTAIGSYISLPHLSGGFLKATVSQDVYTMGNALDAAKTYSSTALRYSLYQACYDSLGEGLDGFEDRLESKLKMYFRKYTRDDYLFLDHYKVSFPEYDVAVSDKASGSLTVTAAGDDLVFDERSDNLSIRLNKGSSLEERISTNCWGLYLAGKELDNSLSQSVQQEVTGWMRGLLASPDKQTFSGSATDYTEKCRELLASSQPESKEDLTRELGMLVKNKVEEELGKLTDLTAASEVNAVTLEIIPTVENVEQGKDSFSLTCSFTYRADYSVQVTLAGKDAQTFPVWNGNKLSFEGMALKFDVSGSQSSEGLVPLEDIDITGEYNVVLELEDLEPMISETLSMGLWQDGTRLTAIIEGFTADAALSGDSFTIKDISLPLGEEPLEYPALFTLSGRLDLSGKLTGGSIEGIIKIAGNEVLFSDTFTAELLTYPEA